MGERRTESCLCSGASCLRKLAILIFRQSETNLLIKSEVWSRAARYFSSVSHVRGKGTAGDGNGKRERVGGKKERKKKDKKERESERVKKIE